MQSTKESSRTPENIEFAASPAGVVERLASSGLIGGFEADADLSDRCKDHLSVVLAEKFAWSTQEGCHE